MILHYSGSRWQLRVVQKCTWGCPQHTGGHTSIDFISSHHPFFPSFSQFTRFQILQIHPHLISCCASPPQPVNYAVKLPLQHGSCLWYSRGQPASQCGKKETQNPNNKSTSIRCTQSHFTITSSALSFSLLGLNLRLICSSSSLSRLKACLRDNCAISVPTEHCSHILISAANTMH